MSDEFNTESMLKFQSMAREYQNKMDELFNKEYTGRCQGISIKMKGDFTVLSVEIAQSCYETAGKAQIETAVKTLFNNLHRAITNEMEDLKKEMQENLTRMQQEKLTSNGTN